MKTCVIPVDLTVLVSLSSAIEDTDKALTQVQEEVIPQLERIRLLAVRAKASITRNSGLTPGALIDITEARDLAMAGIVSTPSPGFGHFGSIAQHFGYMVDRIREC